MGYMSLQCHIYHLIELHMRNVQWHIWVLCAYISRTWWVVTRHFCVIFPVILNALEMQIDIIVSNLIDRECDSTFNTLRPRQNGRHFPDDIFKWIFLNENVWISINISLKFVPRGPINNIPTLVQIMAWRRPGDKPLSETMMARLPTHICVARPQWVKDGIYIKELSTYVLYCFSFSNIKASQIVLLRFIFL